MAVETDKTRSKGKGRPDDEEILAALQERMERIAHGDAPNAGRFCGYCYARLNTGETSCRFCRRQVRDVAAVESVPRDVLRAYVAHYGRMRLWVNVFAFTGIFLAVVLAGLVIVFLPSALKLLSIPVMLGGAWYLANLLGGGIGGHLGMRTGAAARARKWRKYREQRAAEES